MSIPELGQGKSPDGIKVPSAESAFDSKLLERLRNLKPNFMEIMSRMRRVVQKNIGFGSLPKLHYVESLESMRALRETENGLVYPTPPLGFTHDLDDGTEMSDEELYAFIPVDEILNEEARNRIIVMPETGGLSLPLLISIYQHRDFRGDSKDVQLVEASDDVFEGMIAHQIATLFVSDRNYPWFITDFFASKGLNTCRIVEDEEIDSSGFRFGSEGTHDVIASLFGYQDQVLAKLQFMRKCTSAYAENINTDPSLLTGLDRLLQTTDMKIEAVEKYGTPPTNIVPTL